MKLYHALAVAAVAVACGARADVSLDAGDPQYDSSFTNSVRWSDKAVPSSDKTYSVALGADQYLRAPFVTNQISTVSTWGGGALTLGSATTAGWLEIPVACQNLRSTENVPSKWYNYVTIPNLTIRKGGIVFPYSHYSSLWGTSLTVAGDDEAVVRIGGAWPNGLSESALCYFATALKGDNSKVIRFTSNVAAGKAAYVSLISDNSGFTGQMIFDGVYLQDALCETLSDSRFGGDPGYFRADALYFPNGFKYALALSEGSRNPNTGRTLPASGNGNRGITFKNGGYIGGYLSNTWTINMPIVGDTLTVRSGITKYAHTDGLIRFNKQLTVDTVTLDNTYFTRIQFGDDITDETCCLIKMGNLSSVGCRNTCKVRVQAVSGCFFEPRANSAGTSLGNVVVSSDSILTNKTVTQVRVLAPTVPVTAYAKIWWPIVTLPKSLVAEDKIVVESTTGTALTYPYEIRDEDGNWVVYIKRGTISTKYVVPAGTEGNTPTAPYDTWETAANDINTAISAATGSSGWGYIGDTVMVAPGTYDITTPILAEKRIVLRSCDPETGLIDPEHTILDGGYPARTNRIMKLNFARIIGFTFRHGASNGTSYYSGYSTGGGAIDAANGEEFRIWDCIFRENRAINCHGGALGAFMSHGYGTWSVENCLFDGNVTEGTGNGGAFGAETSNGDYVGLSFRNCVFRNNEAYNGGAASCGRPIFFSHCVFSNNVARNNYADIKFNHGYAHDCLFEQTEATTMSLVSGSATHARNVFRNINSSAPVVKCIDSISSYRPLAFTDCVFTNITASCAVCCQNYAAQVPIKSCLFRDNTLDRLLDVHTVGYELDQCTVVSNRFSCNDNWPYLLRSSWIANSILWDNVYTAASPRKLELYLNAAITNSVVEYTNYTSSKENAWVRKPGLLSPTDCHLKPTAFARDKSNREMSVGVTDLDGQPRYVNRRGVANAANARADLGCYEQQKPVPATGVVFLK